MKTAKTKKEVIEVIGTEVKVPKVKLVSYSIKMVIPTGSYANIQPEIIVKAGSVEQAHDFIAPHMNKLWKEYYLISERKPVPVPVVVPTPVAPTPTPVVPAVPAVAQSPVSGVAFLKATQAVQSCLSFDALTLIQNQIDKSVKLGVLEKQELSLLAFKKFNELNAPKADVK